MLRTFFPGNTWYGWWNVSFYFKCYLELQILKPSFLFKRCFKAKAWNVLLKPAAEAVDSRIEKGDWKVQVLD